jgi:hypothetical protein
MKIVAEDLISMRSDRKDWKMPQFLIKEEIAVMLTV